jgi:activator of HSP90 ATPase
MLISNNEDFHMPLRTIEQSVYFNASPQRLYELYLSAREHAAFTGAAVKLQPKAAGKFSAFGGMLSGSFLLLTPGRMIVQRWRSMEFQPNDLDSILTLTFYKERTGCRIHLVHVNVPAHDYQGVTKGWPKYYWKPLRGYLKKAKTEVGR